MATVMHITINQGEVTMPVTLATAIIDTRYFGIYVQRERYVDGSVAYFIMSDNGHEYYHGEERPTDEDVKVFRDAIV
jgi:hypothetical protein